MGHDGFAAVVMAAGDSKRMGRPKLSLPCIDGQTFVERSVSTALTFGCRYVVVVVNRVGMAWLRENTFGWPGAVKIVLNDDPGAGRFLSLQIGLQSLPVPVSVFICNVDSPFAGAEVLHLLSSRSGMADYIRPVYKGVSGHPVLISPVVVHDILHSRGSEDGNVRTFLSGYSSLELVVNDPSVRANINTPDQYRRWSGRDLPEI